MNVGGTEVPCRPVLATSVIAADQISLQTIRLYVLDDSVVAALVSACRDASDCHDDHETICESGANNGEGFRVSRSGSGIDGASVAPKEVRNGPQYLKTYKKPLDATLFIAPPSYLLPSKVSSRVPRNLLVLRVVAPPCEACP